MGSARGEVGCGAYLYCSVPLLICFGVPSGGPPAGSEARPPRARAASFTSDNENGGQGPNYKRELSVS